LGSKVSPWEGYQTIAIGFNFYITGRSLEKVFMLKNPCCSPLSKFEQGTAIGGVEAMPSSGKQRQKPLGSYLVDAGLLSAAQVEVILADQQRMEMSFGEIAAARGWIKQQTVEYIMQKVVEPERSTQSEKLAELQSSMSVQKRELSPEKTTHPQKGTLSQKATLNQDRTTHPPSAEDEDEISWVG
jgi:hypothetical protein